MLSTFRSYHAFDSRMYFYILLEPKLNALTRIGYEVKGDGFADLSVIPRITE